MSVERSATEAGQRKGHGLPPVLGPVGYGRGRQAPPAPRSAGTGAFKSEMAYEFICDRHRCVNCGACMDVCPVRCLNMTRPTQPSVEPSGQVNQWMMEFPVQTDKCTGCNVCYIECPPEAITIATGEEEPAYADVPAVAHRAKGADLTGWVPLSDLTRDPFRRVTSDPWGGLQRWKVAAHRKGHWQVWRTWSEEDIPAEKVAVKR